LLSEHTTATQFSEPLRARHHRWRLGNLALWLIDNDKNSLHPAASSVMKLEIQTTEMSSSAWNIRLALLGAVISDESAR
jgi:hypothetical protein